MKPSNVFGSLNNHNETTTKLSLDDLENFKSMMINDQVIIGCDEVIEMVEDEHTLLECLVFMWQQNSSTFRKNLPLEIKEWFLSKFTEPNKNLSFYKGMHFKRDGNSYTNGKFEVDLNSIDKEGSFITSTTTDYLMAKDFAFGFKNCWLEDDQACCIYKVTGDLVFDVKPYRDFGEEEFIVYNPVFNLVEILN